MKFRHIDKMQRRRGVVVIGSDGQGPSGSGFTYRGSPAEGGAAWLLMSPDPDVAADPWAHPEVADALYPK